MTAEIGNLISNQPTLARLTVAPLSEINDHELSSAFEICIKTCLTSNSLNSAKKSITFSELIPQLDGNDPLGVVVPTNSKLLS